MVPYPRITVTESSPNSRELGVISFPKGGPEQDFSHLGFHYEHCRKKKGVARNNAFFRVLQHFSSHLWPPVGYLINQTLLEEVEEVVAWLAVLAVVSGNWGGVRYFCARLLVSEPVC